MSSNIRLDQSVSLAILPSDLRQEMVQTLYHCDDGDRGCMDDSSICGKQSTPRTYTGAKYEGESCGVESSVKVLGSLDS